MQIIRRGNRSNIEFGKRRSRQASLIIDCRDDPHSPSSNAEIAISFRHVQGERGKIAIHIRGSAAIPIGAAQLRQFNADDKLKIYYFQFIFFCGLYQNV